MKRILFIKNISCMLCLISVICSQGIAQTDTKETQILDMYCDLMANAAYQSKGGYILATNVDTIVKGGEYAAVLNMQPAFSWSITTDKENFEQTAYQIFVADSPNELTEESENIWDSGKVNSGQSTAIPFGGHPLIPNKTFFWKIKIWSGDLDEPVESRITSFRTGNLSQAYQTPRYPLQRIDQYPRLLQSLSENK